MCTAKECKLKNERLSELAVELHNSLEKRATQQPKKRFIVNETDVSELLCICECQARQVINHHNKLFSPLIVPSTC